MKNYVLVILVALFVSCRAKPHRKHVFNDLLLSSTVKEVYSADELTTLSPTQISKLMSSTFNRKTDTISYLKDKIYVSCLTTAPGCAQYSADINIDADTIVINLINKGDFVCTEMTCWRVTCVIRNEGNKRYVFKK